MLNSIRANVRFISADPLLCALRDLDSIDWLIVGGESGPSFRPIDPDRARDLRDRVVESGVPYFYKQSSDLRTETDTLLDEEEWRPLLSSDEFVRQLAMNMLPTTVATPPERGFPTL